MKRKINKRLFLTATLAIVATLLLTVAVCYNLLKKQIMEDLQIYAKSTAHYLEIDSSEAVNGEEIKKRLASFEAELLKDDIRITLVDEEGIARYDSEVPVEKLANHKDRPEIKEALETGEGSEIRKSDTLDKNTYYYALLLENGSVFRVAKDADSIYTLMEYAVPYLLVIVAVLIFLCGILSYYMAEGIMRPVKQVAENVENVDNVETYEEMKPFIDAIKKQHDDVLENAKLRQEFTANVSHELKTPLTAISGYSELIENGMVVDESEIRRFCLEIHKSAGRLLTLINDVIRLSELDDSENNEVLEPINLLDSAKACVSMLQINAEKHHVTLFVEGESAMIMANKQMVEEILYNLCDNAIRYNRENGSVSVTVEDRLDMAVLTVKDTGIGIPKEHQERIFERFYRVDKSRSKSTGGTGLGLAIVKHILIKLNATISLKSEPDKGTEITVTFPAVRDALFR
ncbi:MAG: ATP-binding protein [Suilimivivens sp.]